VDVSFQDAVKGASRTVRYQVPKPCASCEGSGVAKNAKPSLHKCTKCKGLGHVTQNMPGLGQFRMACRWRRWQQQQQQQQRR
jgi:DnaJ-class molecular chaperone